MSEEECKLEQIGEIEALESIYCEELKMSCELQFNFTPLYPHELPLIEIETESLSDDRIEELKNLMTSLGEENMGMPMVFTMVAEVLDKLNEYFDENTELREEAVERAIREAEEADRKKFEGTRCTVENFMAWKLKFDAEREDQRKAKKLQQIDANKPTGYELFMRDKTLDESDLKFLDDEDIGAVDVDESLFDDMDDLELDGEISDT